MSKASISSELDIEDLDKDACKRFAQQFPLIQQMRRNKSAPVDTMGCFSLHDRQAKPKIQRFQIFVSLLLSPRTKDEKTAIAVHNLREHGLTVENVIDTPADTIGEMIKMVGMWKQKADYLKANAVVLRDKHDSDVPNTFEELVALRGVGPKIASLTLMHCYQSKKYIGVDTHVHRISNRLWIKTKTPEQTEEQLKQIVPRDLWQDANLALVGFGQTICKAKPLCDKCLLQSTCPVAKTFLKRPKTKR